MAAPPPIRVTYGKRSGVALLQKQRLEDDANRIFDQHAATISKSQVTCAKEPSLQILKKPKRRPVRRPITADKENIPGPRNVVLQHSKNVLESLDLSPIGNSSAGVYDNSTPRQHRVEVPLSSNTKCISDFGSWDSFISKTPVLTSVVSLFKRLSLSTTNEKRPMQELLDVCGQLIPLDFSTLIPTELNSENVEKIGEATYSEVFAIDGDAMKVIPLFEEKSAGDIEETSLQDAILEIRISKAVSSLNGFVEGKKYLVCQGKYPQQLVDAWEVWAENNVSESKHPNCLDDQQLYAILLMERGGKDLENFAFQSHVEAKHCLQQLCLYLAAAEEKLHFEHRDLHWGNILLSRRETSREQAVVVRNSTFHINCAITCTLIDFTYSRFNDEERIIYRPITDEAIFEGAGDYQYDIYRRMRDELKDQCWSTFCPRTNVYWVDYVADKMLYAKAYPKSKVSAVLRELKQFRRRVLRYDSCIELVLNDALFAECRRNRE